MHSCKTQTFRGKGKTRKYLFAPVQTIFPELKMRAVVRGSLILMITAANLYKFKGGPDRNLAVFLYNLATINTVKASHNTYLLCKCFFTTLKLFSTYLGAGKLRWQSQDHWDPSALGKGSLGKALSPRLTFGLYSAFLACRAMFFRSSLQARFTVDTIFLRNEGGIFSLHNEPLQSHPPAVLAKCGVTFQLIIVINWFSVSSPL